MGRHRKPRPGGAITQSDEARRLLRNDTPPAVKLRLLLALRGGRMERRRCLGCRKTGIYCKVWSPAEVWGVESQSGEGLRVYWLCQDCNARFATDGLPPELERRLRG
jgi:hypothetical protein